MRKNLPKFFYVLYVFQVIEASQENKNVIPPPHFIKKIEGKSAHGIFKGFFKKEFLKKNLSPVLFGANGIKSKDLPHFFIIIDDYKLFFQLEPELAVENLKNVALILTGTDLKHQVGKLKIKNIMIKPPPKLLRSK